MTNLDHLYYGAQASGDEEVQRQTDELFDALYELDKQHPEGVPETPFVMVDREVFNRLMAAYRLLTA